LSIKIRRKAKRVSLLRTNHASQIGQINLTNKAANTGLKSEDTNLAKFRKKMQINLSFQAIALIP